VPVQAISAPLAGAITGGVYAFSSKAPVANANVTLEFVATGQVYSASTDPNGLFSFSQLPLAGSFLVRAEDGLGAKGSVDGSLLQGEPSASVLIYIDSEGTGLIQGRITSMDQEPRANVVVKAIFPHTGREYTATSASTGDYSITGVHTDGTFVLIAFENDTGASASFSSAVTPEYPTATVNLVLWQPTVINSELTNPYFTDGLTGWIWSGPVQIVDSDLVFSPIQ
ncbi:MAG TPA: carboxypeptidase-like regulatory domain-containing protein, partial [Polyangiaceae bacterium]